MPAGRVVRLEKLFDRWLNSVAAELCCLYVVVFHNLQQRIWHN